MLFSSTQYWWPDTVPGKVPLWWDLLLSDPEKETDLTKAPRKHKYWGHLWNKMIQIHPWKRQNLNAIMRQSPITHDCRGDLKTLIQKMKPGVSPWLLLLLEMNKNMHRRETQTHRVLLAGALLFHLPSSSSDADPVLSSQVTPAVGWAAETFLSLFAIGGHKQQSSLITHQPHPQQVIFPYSSVHPRKKATGTSLHGKDFEATRNSS